MCPEETRTEGQRRMPLFPPLQIEVFGISYNGELTGSSL